MLPGNTTVHSSTRPLAARQRYAERCMRYSIMLAYVGLNGGLKGAWFLPGFNQDSLRSDIYEGCRIFLNSKSFPDRQVVIGG